MRPRERYALFGPEESTDADLLALIIGVGAGGRSTHELAASLLERFGSLAGVAQAPVEALRRVSGVGPARAVRLHAALHAGRRAAQGVRAAIPNVRTPESAWALLRPGLEDKMQEELHALYMDRRGQVLWLCPLTRGNDHATLVEPRQVLRPAVQCGASSVIIAHNHPSGDPTPSQEDIAVTRRLVSAGKIVGVDIVDHLIIGQGCFTSLKVDGFIADR